MKKELFGTDGIRGQYGGFPITPEDFFVFGRTIGKLAKKKNKNCYSVVLANDGRNSCELLVQSFISGLICEHVHVLNLGTVPTPVLASAIEPLSADYGIMITASHNHESFNGIKFFDSIGVKFTKNMQNEFISDFLSIASESNIKITSSHKYEDAQSFAIQEYIKKINRICSRSRTLTSKPKKIAISCANGASSYLIPKIFTELGFVCHTIGANLGSQINDPSLDKKLSNVIIDEICDFGVAYDGDGDRAIIYDENGKKADGDQLFFSLIGKLNADDLPIVTTHASSMNFTEAVNQEYGCRVKMVDIGDSNVYFGMKKINALLGGERSGHILYQKNCSTGDGFFASLCFVDIISDYENVKASTILKRFIPCPSFSINIPFDSCSNLDAIIEKAKYINIKMANKARVFIRKSGTEDVIRVLIEGLSIPHLEEALENMNIIKQHAIL